MSLAEFNRWTSFLTIATAVGLLIRLLWLRLARKYGWLFGYLAADIAQGALLIGTPTRSLRYGYVYFSGEAAKALLVIAVAIQLWLLVLQEYPAVARFGRRILIYLLAGALLVAAIGLLLEPPQSGGQSVFPHYFNAIEGVLDSMVVVFLVAATLFLLWFPVEVPRNAAILIGGFVFYLLQLWAGLLLTNLHPLSAHGVGAVLVSIELACLIFWVLALRKNGEFVKTVTGHRWNPEEAERLLGQLVAINTRLGQIAP